MSSLIRVAGRVSADAYWQLIATRADYTTRFLAALDRAQVDACVCPPHALPALLHGSSGDLTMAASYCFLPNLLNMPTGVVAASRVREGEETDRPLTRDRVDKLARKVELHSGGLPVGVQVFARRWREAIVLAVMAQLEQHFRSHSEYPGEPPL